MKLDFIDKFSKKTQVTYFIKFRLLGAELFRAGRGTYGQTRHGDSSSRFSQFCKSALKKQR